MLLLLLLLKLFILYTYLYVCICISNKYYIPAVKKYFRRGCSVFLCKIITELNLYN